MYQILSSNFKPQYFSLKKVPFRQEFETVNHKIEIRMSYLSFKFITYAIFTYCFSMQLNRTDCIWNASI